MEYDRDAMRRVNGKKLSKASLDALLERFNSWQWQHRFGRTSRAHPTIPVDFFVKNHRAMPMFLVAIDVREMMEHAGHVPHAQHYEREDDYVVFAVPQRVHDLTWNIAPVAQPAADGSTAWILTCNEIPALDMQPLAYVSPVDGALEFSRTWQRETYRGNVSSLYGPQIVGTFNPFARTVRTLDALVGIDGLNMGLRATFVDGNWKNGARFMLPGVYPAYSRIAISMELHSRNMFVPSWPMGMPLLLIDGAAGRIGQPALGELVGRSSIQRLLVSRLARAIIEWDIKGIIAQIPDLYVKDVNDRIDAILVWRTLVGHMDNIHLPPVAYGIFTPEDTTAYAAVQPLMARLHGTAAAAADARTQIREIAWRRIQAHVYLLLQHSGLVAPMQDAIAERLFVYSNASAMDVEGDDDMLPAGGTLYRL